MNKRIFTLLIFILALGITPVMSVSARSQKPRLAINTPAQLIDAVNNLRISNGLAPLTVHAVLMQSAQSQADYMAATGQVTHARPGGITFTQQLISLGFPLAGELSLGGLRSENILNSQQPLDWNGVPPAWQDATHMTTMLSASYTHIGAGISKSASGYFYALDCATATGSGVQQPQAIAAMTSNPSSASAAVSQFIVPVTLNTALPDGRVLHTLQYGQTLWSLAIEYGTTIRQIQQLNNLGDDLLVRQGQELLVSQGATQPAPPTADPTLSPPFTPSPTPVLLSPTPTSLPVATPTLTPPTPQPQSTLPLSSSSSLLIGVLVVAAFIGGGVAVWLIRDPR